jgi:hypothetical protein
MKKGKYATQVVTRELWKEFTKAFPEYKDMSWKDFSDYWNDIAATIREETIFNPLGVKLGHYTGELKYQYLPHRYKAKDRNTSLELGVTTNFVNLVTRGKVGKIKWERRWAVRFNKMLQFYAFEPNRDMNDKAKVHTEANPETLRTARNTLGGYSIWRQLKQHYTK